ncbi:MAG TPA: TolC family protein, partial [Pirellulaceae bacterium]
MRSEPRTSGGAPPRVAARFHVALLISGLLLSGCHPIQPYYLHEDGDLSHYLDVATEIEYPDLEECPLPDVTECRAPITLLDPEFDEWWDLTLEEAISIAMHNTKAFNTLGGVRQLGQVVGNPPSRVSQSPDGVPTIYDVAIQEAGQTGVEQALSNFDAIFRSTTTWDSSDRPQNFRGAIQQLVNSPALQTDQVNINNEISKLTAGGSQFFFRNVSIYDGANNELTRNTRELPSSWFTALEAEVRHPLLRGRGVQLNRIPVVLARMRTDTALADFQEAVETLLTEVETAYWELYFQYRTLEATRLGRDSALAAWQRVNALAGEPSGSRDREAQAREQYYTFKAALFDSLRSVQVTETRLRFLMGIASTDGRFIRPSEEPTSAQVEFDWQVVHCEALTSSNELRRQRWRIKQRELELIAAKNQLLPQVDVVGLYRWLGVGDEFNVSGTSPPFPIEGSSAVAGLLQGDNQEFRLGLSAELNVGFRRELAQVRTQQLALVRERARLDTAELEIVSQLTDAYQNLVANYELIQVNMNRRIAAAQQVEAAEAGQEQGNVDLFTLLNAQNRRADADTQYFRTIVDYNLSLINLHRVKGSLLAFNNVLMAEGPWPEKAYFDAQNLARQRDASYYFDYGYSRPRVSSRGPIDQFGAPGCEDCVE